MIANGKLDEFPWQDCVYKSGVFPEAFSSPAWTERILDGLSIYKPGTFIEDQDRLKTVSAKLEECVPHSKKRLEDLANTLKALFVKKDEIIDMVFVCAIAHQPMLLVGEPGTAKSKIVLRFCDGLGLNRGHTDRGEHDRHSVFQFLLHAFSEPDELLGPVNIEKLRKESIFERFRKGSITDSEVVFLDEVFRANSAILNVLLSVMNERQVYEGGKVIPAKARLIFGASNSVPNARQLEDLRAFYERFIIRVESEPLQMEFEKDGGGPIQERVDLLTAGWGAEVRDLRASYRPGGAALGAVACLNDVLLLNRAIAECWGGAALGDHKSGWLRDYHNLVVGLGRGEDPPCRIDDRKFVRLMTIIKARALYVHAGPPQTSDLSVLRHVWHDLESKSRVVEEVDKVAGAVPAPKAAPSVAGGRR